MTFVAGDDRARRSPVGAGLVFAADAGAMNVVELRVSSSAVLRIETGGLSSELEWAESKREAAEGRSFRFSLPSIARRFEAIGTC